MVMSDSEVGVLGELGSSLKFLLASPQLVPTGSTRLLCELKKTKCLPCCEYLVCWTAKGFDFILADFCTKFLRFAVPKYFRSNFFIFFIFIGD